MCCQEEDSRSDQEARREPKRDQTVAWRQASADPLAGLDDQALHLGVELRRTPQFVLAGARVRLDGRYGRHPLAIGGIGVLRSIP
jgi:hypothetical protein